MRSLLELGVVMAFARWVAASLLALILLADGEAAAEWTVRAEAAKPGAPPRCVIESERHPLRDGYQDTWAQVVVDDKSVRVTSASELDAGDRDIGLTVDAGAFVAADEVAQKTAVFTARYADLVAEFKRGRSAQLQLRFWPTWPKTGTHSVAISLIGFTRAHARMPDCRVP